MTSNGQHRTWLLLVSGGTGDAVAHLLSADVITVEQAAKILREGVYLPADAMDHLTQVMKSIGVRDANVCIAEPNQAPVPGEPALLLGNNSSGEERFYLANMRRRQENPH